MFIPLGKRGIKREYGKWALPGGYLDWNETLKQCAFRETFEELDLKLWEYVNVEHTFNKPHDILDQTKSGDIVMVYGCSIKVDTLPTLKAQAKEVLDVTWANVMTDIIKNPTIELAFNHKDLITEYVYTLLSANR